MTTPDGIYKIYKLRHDDNGEQHRRLAARLFIHNGQVRHLESHHSSIESMFPEGDMTTLHKRRFVQLQHSPYFEVMHEGDIAAGHHIDEIEHLDVGPVEAEHRFIMTGSGIQDPKQVEMWDDAVVVDGKRLDETDAHHLLGEVAAGRVILTPIG